MKKLNYEYSTIILFFIFVFFLGIIYIICFALSKKVNTYSLIPGIIKQKNLVEVMVNNEQLNLLYDNGILYVDDNKLKYKIDDISKDVLVNKKNKYSLVQLKVKTFGKENDVVNLVLCKKRIKLYKIFEMVWKGENNANS